MSEDLENARFVTLDCIFLELWCFEMEDNGFCIMCLSYEYENW